MSTSCMLGQGKGKRECERERGKESEDTCDPSFNAVISRRAYSGDKVVFTKFKMDYFYATFTVTIYGYFYAPLRNALLF